MRNSILTLLLTLCAASAHGQVTIFGEPFNGGSSSTNATSIQGTPASSTQPLFGQPLASDGTQYAPSFGSPALFYSGVNFFGDSITCGFSANNYSGDPSSPSDTTHANNGYAYLLAPELGGAARNYCKSGDQQRT